MKKLVVSGVMLFIFSLPAFSQKKGDFGAGAVLGDPTSVTAKYWLSDTQALDAGLGYSNRFAVNADYLWHAWKIFPQPEKGKMPGYLGLGFLFRTFSTLEVGIRTMAGLAYWFPNDPIEIFAELGPVFRLSHGGGVDLNGGIGLRYYFQLSR